MIDVKKSRAICEAATEGPLTVGESPLTGRPVVWAEGGRVCGFYRGNGCGHHDEDAAFVAHARTALPRALPDWLEEVER